MSSKLFLASTPCLDFWDKSAKNYLLLGDWCLSKKSKEFLKGKNYKVLDSPWTDEFITMSGKYCFDLIKFWLPHLSRILNHEHKIDKSTKYWKILLSAWLMEYIQVIYVKYSLIKKTKEAFGPLYTTLLNKESFLRVKDHNNHAFLVRNEVYHLQLFTIVAEGLGLEGFEADYRKAKENYFNDLINRKKNSLTQLYKNTLQRLTDFFLKNEVLVQLDFSFQQNLLYSISSKYNFFLGTFLSYNTSDFIARDKFNRNCFKQLPARNQFEEILRNSLIWGFPDSYGECFNGIRKFVETCFPNTRLLIASQPNIPDSMNFLGATVIEKGGRLAVFQHGGGYGHYELYGYPQEMVERFKANIFLSWGWEDPANENFCKVEPIAEPRFTLLHSTHKRKNDDLIFVGAYPVSYPFRLSHIFLKTMKYFGVEKKILSLISPQYFKHLVYKKDICEDGDPKEMLQSFSDLKMTNKNLVSLMKDCRMVIMDFLATAFIEALVLNTPTVLLLHDNLFVIRSGARPFFDSLTEVRIVHKTPESAAEFINQALNENKLEEWWNQPKTQKARNEFVQHYGFNSSAAIENWKKLISRELRVASNTID